MKLFSKGFLMAYLSMMSICCYSQSITEFGTWQSFPKMMDAKIFPDINGRMIAFNWKDIEPSNNQWVWTSFDSSLNAATGDNKPIIFMVYTKEEAPDWIFLNGVPKVIEKDNQGKITGYSPYYPDEDYKFFFQRMITNVRKHVESLKPEIRNNIIAYQACFGSTGDYISYKGNVDPQYQLTTTDFGNLFAEFTTYCYNEYKNTNPKIYLLSNPHNNGKDQTNWLITNCPGGWIKTGSIGKGYQLNDEKSKSGWLMNVLNEKQNGEFVRARSEISGQVSQTPWWKSSEPKNNFALFCSEIHWGVDISNQTPTQVQNHNNDTAYRFFNKYAGEKDATQSLYAVSALKDVLDASDENRFPSSKYGTMSRTNETRYQNIQKAFATYGALLQDPKSATMDEMGNLQARGINDVGWDLLPGNYERFLYQINANETSVGYWNIASADPNTIYGRFGRGFEIKSNKTALYFNLDDRFLNNAPLNAAYAITIEVTYLDKGAGSFKLYYDGKKNANSQTAVIKLTNTNKWKKASFTLKDAYFGNRGLNKSDFSIRNAGNSDVIFSVVELARPTIKSVRNMGANEQSAASVSIKNEQPENKAISIMPNPVQYQFSVQLSDFSEMGSIQIFDLSGRTVYQKEVKSQKTTISKSEIGSHPGTFIIKVTTGSHTYSSKIVVL